MTGARITLSILRNQHDEVEAVHRRITGSSETSSGVASAVMAQEGTFGGLLRSYRHRARLTQEEIAERAGVGVRTIRDLETDRVTTPRLSSLRSLANAFDLTDAERDSFIDRARRRGEQPDRHSDRPGGQIPVPLTRLIGRTAEVAVLVDTMTNTAARLVSLTGVAGIGKTRVALAAADALQRRGQRVWWVPLSAVSESRFVVDAIAMTINARERSVSGIRSRLGDRAALLVIDNLEHLEGVSDVVEELLGALPEVAILATSRAPIGIVGEHEWPLGPLPSPPDDIESGDELSSVESVALLADRIRATDPSWQPSSVDAPTVAEVCRRLDGIPLALELAARQWRMRGASGVLDAIRTNPLQLADVTDTRSDVHASVQNALDASYQLLSKGAQRALHDLAVFHGGWTMRAANAVVAATPAAKHLDRLLSLGLIDTEDTETGRRFTMLPIIRSFACSSAREDSATSVAPDRHARYFRKWAKDLDDRIVRDPRTVLRAFDADRENLRAALAWFDRNDASAGLDLVVSLSAYWGHRAARREALDWFGAFVNRAGDAGVKPLAQMLAAMHAHFLGRTQEGMSLARQSLETCRQRHDVQGCAEALAVLGMLNLTAAPRRAIEHLREAADLAKSIGHVQHQAWALGNVATALTNLGRLDEAGDTRQKALVLATEANSVYHIGLNTMNMIEIYRLAGDLEAAHRQFMVTETVVSRVDDPEVEVMWLAQGALVDAQRGDVEHAIDLAERAAATANEADVSRYYMNTSWMALGEVRHAEGRSNEAFEWFRRAVVNALRGEYPMLCVQLLTGVALLTDDIEIAALGIAAVHSIRDRIGMNLPAVAAARLNTVNERWSAHDSHRWTQRLAHPPHQPPDALLNLL